MSKHPEFSNVSRRQFLAVAGSVAAASSFAAGKDVSVALPPSPPPSVDYPVTINTTTKPITYTTPTLSDASTLRVKLGQTVTWKVITAGKHYHVTIMFLTTPLVDASNRPMWAVYGSEADEGSMVIGGTIGQNTSDDTYEYYVRVVDDATKTVYTDDPRIIVGNGDADARTEIALALRELRNADAKLSSKPKVQERIKPIEHKLEHLINELK